MPKYYAVHCDQCLAMVINGHACHEQGCPNSKKPWVYDEKANSCYPGETENTESDDEF